MRRCVTFPLIILEMFFNFLQNLPVEIEVLSVSKQKKQQTNHEVKGIVASLVRQDCLRNSTKIIWSFECPEEHSGFHHLRHSFELATHPNEQIAMAGISQLRTRNWHVPDVVETHKNIQVLRKTWPRSLRTSYWRDASTF